jgi:sodium pump decarboxylase gamma subunit
MENLELGIMLAIVGMLIVFLGLSILAAVIGGLNRLNDAYELRAPARSGAAALPAGRPATPAGQIDPQTLAVITAAACAVLNRPVQIRKVDQASPADRPF